MNSKKFLFGTLAGTITSFIGGFLVYGMALTDYLGANSVTKDVPQFHWIIIGHILFAVLVTYIFLKWAGIKTLLSGAKAAAIIGILVSLAYNLTLLGGSDYYSGGLPTAIIDSLGATVVWAAGGAGVGWALGRGEQEGK